MQRVQFVCLGNICRSPLAEGVLRKKLEDAGLSGVIEVQSAGTGGWHVGQGPDSRMRRTAQDHGVSLAGISARKFSEEDLDDFDYIFAMDRSNLRDIESMTWTKHHAEVALFRSLDPEAEGSLDVPDPYYGRDDGFERVFDIVDRTCDVILRRVRADIGESESGNS